MRLFSLGLLLLIITSCKDQKTANNDQLKPLTAEIVSSAEVKELLTESVKKEFKLDYPVFRGYRYNDKSGEFLCVLTESNDSIGTENDDTINYSIKAVTLKIQKDKFEKVWEINDNIIKDKNEETIWFWTRFFDFKDFDNDGLIEPIVVYGTRGLNGYDDGRIKFIIYYKGQKYIIRQQNSLFDGQRDTQVEDKVYTLPENLKDSIQSKMNVMHKEEKAIFTLLVSEYGVPDTLLN
jgi:hypothetical protein